MWSQKSVAQEEIQVISGCAEELKLLRKWDILLPEDRPETEEGSSCCHNQKSKGQNEEWIRCSGAPPETPVWEFVSRGFKNGRKSIQIDLNGAVANLLSAVGLYYMTKKKDSEQQLKKAELNLCSLSAFSVCRRQPAEIHKDFAHLWYGDWISTAERLSCWCLRCLESKLTTANSLLRSSYLQYWGLPWI